MQYSLGNIKTAPLCIRCRGFEQENGRKIVGIIMQGAMRIANPEEEFERNFQPIIANQV